MCDLKVGAEVGEVGAILAKIHCLKDLSGSTMLFKALSAAVYGIDAHIIDVEVDFSSIKLDKEQFSTVGLP
ncbi:MAG: hypothetical protein WA840_02755, partial [Caulobacteraceae bacterium]